MDPEGFLIFMNILSITSTFLITVGMIGLFIIYSETLIKCLGTNAIETICYLFSGSMIYFAPFIFNSNFAHYISLIFSAVITCCSFYSLSSRTKEQTGIMTLFYFINIILYGSGAIHFYSRVYGFISIMALMGLIGFNISAGHLSVGIGFTNEDVIPSATFSSLIILIMGLYLKFHPVLYSELFVMGMIFLGSFIYFTGISILSSYFYIKKFNTVYVNMQIIASVSFLMSLLFGNIWQVGQLYSIGGTFGVFFILQKYVEIMPRSAKAYIWSCFIIGSIFYLLMYLVHACENGKYFYYGLLTNNNTNCQSIIMFLLEKVGKTTNN